MVAKILYSSDIWAVQQKKTVKDKDTGCIVFSDDLKIPYGMFREGDRIDDYNQKDWNSNL